MGQEGKRQNLDGFWGGGTQSEENPSRGEEKEGLGTLGKGRLSDRV